MFDVACKMIIDEVQYAIKKEDPKKMIEVSMCMGTMYSAQINIWISDNFQPLGCLGAYVRKFSFSSNMYQSQN